jgi:predicted TIM-barrel fold metal-dependent hydrolase
MEYNVISTDDHIIEAPNCFVDYLLADLRGRAPRISRMADGGDGWTLDGKPLGESFGLSAMAGRPYEDYKASGLTFEEILPGNYDGRAHLADMELDGIDAAVIFPLVTSKTYELSDRPFAVALMRAYNNWLLDEFCSADAGRLIGLPVLPVDDGIGVLVAEFERVVHMGAKGVFVPYYPEIPYPDRFYEPFWSVAAEAAVPVCIHRMMGGKPRGEQVTPAITEVSGMNVAGIVERFFSGVAPFSRITFSGVFERHPSLKFVDAEVNGGWLRFWAQMMDQEFERQRHWSKLPLVTPPSEFLGTNLFVSVLDDFVGFADAQGDERVAAASMFSTDYPHSTTLFPHTRDYLAKLTAGLSPERTHAVLAGNAIRVFNLDG